MDQMLIFGPNWAQNTILPIFVFWKNEEREEIEKKKKKEGNERRVQEFFVGFGGGLRALGLNRTLPERAFRGMNATGLSIDLAVNHSSVYPVDIWMFVGWFEVDNKGHSIACWNMIEDSHLL